MGKYSKYILDYRLIYESPDGGKTVFVRNFLDIHSKIKYEPIDNVWELLTK